MKRFSFIFVFLCLFMICTPVFSLAVDQPDTVNSVMYEPEVSHIGNVLKFYKVFYNASTAPHYAVSVVTVTGGSNFRINGTSWFFSDSEFSVEQVIYDVETGIVSRIVNDQPYYNQYGNYWQYFIFSDFPNYYVLPDDVSMSNNGKLVDPFVNWAPIVPYVHTYSSYLSEPISDPYNRYIVLAGDDHQYIFLLSFSLSDLTMFNSQSINQGGDEIDLDYNNVFIPVLKLDNNQLKLELDIDPQIFYILNNTDNHLYKYNLMFAKYNLVDGQYISSSLYSGSISSSTTSLAFDFGSASDYDSIKTYGVQYIDEMTSQWHYNLLHCSWGHDPAFETWQENVLFYLQGIYESLVDDSGDSVPTTNPVVESQVDSYVSEEHSYMQSFDDAGTTVDVVFSEAESQMSSSSNAFDFITNIFNSFVFGFDLPYIVLFISMTFGFVLLLIGRKMGA